jgi:hypothetical protein
VHCHDENASQLKEVIVLFFVLMVGKVFSQTKIKKTIILIYL